MKALITLLAALLLTGSLAQASPRLPEMGDPASQALSPAQERELGKRLMAEVRRHLPLLEDPEAVEYVRDLGARLASHSSAPTLDFHFFIIDDPAINAFAMPGGYIGINAGLILNARSESELAAVLAHEIAHVTQRHIARRMAEAGNLNFRMAAMLLASLLLGSQNRQMGQAAATASMAGSIQQQLNYSRAFEHEADHLGINLLAEAGLDPRGMPAFFDRLSQATRYGSRPPEYLSTHPVTESRIANSASRAERLKPGKVFESPSFALIQAKIAVLKAPQPAQAARDFEAQLRQGGAVARYGLALAQIADRRYAEAATHLDQLIAQDGEQLPYLLARARTELAAGRLQPALERFGLAHSLYPGSQAARYHYAEALIQARQSDRAYRLLSRGLPSAEPATYRLLARAASEAGLGAEPQLAMSEYYYLRGDLPAALGQLQQAIRSTAATPHQVARASARQEELQREYDQLAKDE